jgi:hypothetical protein
MGQRRVLIVASQCVRLNELEFIPAVAEQLYAVMTDPQRGECVPALSNCGLLINPTVHETRDSITNAFVNAARDQATLFLAFIGHGEMMDNDFYFLPYDSKAPANSFSAIQLTTHIKELAKSTSGHLDGLCVLIDTCYSGVAGISAAHAWIAGLKGTLRFEVLTAASDLPAADGCFTRTLTSLLIRGIDHLPTPNLYCRDLRPKIEQICVNQEPQHPSYNADDTLWLVRNRGHSSEPWANTALAETIKRLTQNFQPTENLIRLAMALEAHKHVALLGNAGAGKSTLVAALAWPAITDGIVVPGFIHGVVILTESVSLQDIAKSLAEQLSISLSGFSEARRSFRTNLRQEDLPRLNALEREIIEPLKTLYPVRVRLLFDGLDRLHPSIAESVIEILNRLSNLEPCRLLVTARPDTDLPHVIVRIPIATPSSEELKQYLNRRAIDSSRHNDILKVASGNWLVVRMLADLLHDDPRSDLEKLGLTLGDAYDEMLSRTCASSQPKTHGIFSILVAAGAGPAIPISLVMQAARVIGLELSLPEVRDELVQLRGLVVRNSAGTENEQVGVFHQTLVDHFSNKEPRTLIRAHEAITTALRTIAPPIPGNTALTTPAHKYGFDREAEHYWALGQIEKAIVSLRTRIGPVPKDNLSRARHWEKRIRESLGAEHPHTFDARSEVAYETGQCGNASEALELYTRLLSDMEQLFGIQSAETLPARHNVALWKWQCGDKTSGLTEMLVVEAERERILGPMHPDTLTTKNVLASWNLVTNDPRQTLAILLDLLRDREKVLGPRHIDTLTTRNNINFAMGSLGDNSKALRDAVELLPTLVDVVGEKHPLAMKCEQQISHFREMIGDLPAALDSYRTLCSKQSEVLGLSHPDVLKTRAAIGKLVAQLESPENARKILEDLLSDCEQAYGRSHPDTLSVRFAHAQIAALNDPITGEKFLVELLPEMQTALGRRHPETLSLKFTIALFSLRQDPESAFRQLSELLVEHQQSLGLRHQNTLAIDQLIQQLRAKGVGRSNEA